MNTKIITAIIISVVIGYVIRYSIDIYTQQHSDSARMHWEAIDHYNSFNNDPQNRETHPNGLTSINGGPKIGLSLAHLVDLNEITYIDLVLPSVKYTPLATRTWMQFANDNKDSIIYMLGNPRYVNFKIDGEVPLHLQIWYKTNSDATIQRLMDILEALPKSDKE